MPGKKYDRMQPARVGSEHFLAAHVNARAKCPTYATIRITDHQIRHWRLFKGQPPQDFHPNLRPWPNTEESEFMVEQELQNLIGDPRRLLLVRDWNGFRIVARRAHWDYDKKGCQPMRGYVFDKDADGKNKGLVFFLEEIL